MATTTDTLFTLVKSLTEQEQKTVKTELAKSAKSGVESVKAILFQLLVKTDDYDDAKVFAQLNKKRGKALSVTKESYSVNKTQLKDKIIEVLAASHNSVLCNWNRRAEMIQMLFIRRQFDEALFQIAQYKKEALLTPYVHYVPVINDYAVLILSETAETEVSKEKYFTTLDESTRISKNLYLTAHLQAIYVRAHYLQLSGVFLADEKSRATHQQLLNQIEETEDVSDNINNIKNFYYLAQMILHRLDGNLERSFHFAEKQWEMHYEECKEELDTMYRKVLVAATFLCDSAIFSKNKAALESTVKTAADIMAREPVQKRLGEEMHFKGHFRHFGFNAIRMSNNNAVIENELIQLENFVKENTLQLDTILRKLLGFDLVQGYYQINKPEKALHYLNGILESESQAEYANRVKDVFYLVRLMICLDILNQNPNNSKHFDQLDKYTQSLKRRTQNQPGGYDITLDKIFIKSFESIVKQGGNQKEIPSALQILKSDLTQFQKQQPAFFRLLNYYIDFFPWIDKHLSKENKKAKP